MICWHGQTVYHWVEGAHALGTCSSASRRSSPSGRVRRSSPTCARGRRRRRARRAAREPARRARPRQQSRPRARLLNLGGISNVTVVGPGREPLAYDIGPANALVDAVVAAETGGREIYDAGGARAARGTVDAELLAVFLDEPTTRSNRRSRPARNCSTSIRAGARSRPRDRDQRPARDAHRALGRDGGRRPEAARGRDVVAAADSQPDVDGRARPRLPGGRSRPSTCSASPRRARRPSCSPSSAS